MLEGLVSAVARGGYLVYTQKRTKIIKNSWMMLIKKIIHGGHIWSYRKKGFYPSKKKKEKKGFN